METTESSRWRHGDDNRTRLDIGVGMTREAATQASLSAKSRPASS